MLLDTSGCGDNMGFDIYCDNELDEKATEQESQFYDFLQMTNMKELNVANFLEAKNKYESPEVRKELLKKNASQLSASISSNSVLGASSIIARR